MEAGPPPATRRDGARLQSFQFGVRHLADVTIRLTDDLALVPGDEMTRRRARRQVKERLACLFNHLFA